MKKIYLLSIFTGLFLSQVFAQTNKDTAKPVLSLFMFGGVSIPLKNFNVNFPATAVGSESGYAKTGEDIDIFFNVSHIKNIHPVEFGLFCGYTSNSFYIQGYRQFEAMFEGINLDNLQPSHYQMLRILPALMCSYGKRFSVNGRIMGGVFLLKTPTMAYQVQEAAQGAVIYQVESRNAINLACDFGVGLKYIVSNKFSIVLNADYFHSSPDIKTPDINYSFEIREVSITAGMGYIL